MLNAAESDTAGINPEVKRNRPPLFTIRAAMMLLLLAAICLSWRWSAQHARTQLAQHWMKLKYAEIELKRARDQLSEERRAKHAGEPRVLSEVVLDGAHLRGVTITSSTNAFQRGSFKDCDLKSAILKGGVSAFQLAQFDNSNLVNAQLTGGDAAFQAATFIGSDLTGAVLNGGFASFYQASFEKATLVAARLVGSFQEVNISGARFEQADLSLIDAESLASCYFKEAPTYDAKTRFAKGFDPQGSGWRMISQ